MRLLERYIFLELARVFGVLLALTTCLLVCVGIFGQAREHGLGPGQVLQILPFIIPSLLPYTVPTTLLLTVCVVYGRMAGDREVIAAKAAGINILWMLWPSFLLSALLSVASLVLCDQVIPWANARIERIVMLAMEDILLDQLRTQYHYTIPKAGISITVIGVEDRTLIEPVFRYVSKGGKPSIVQAKEARLKFDLQRRQVLVEMKHVRGDAQGQTHLWLESVAEPFRLPYEQKLKIRTLRLQDLAETTLQANRDAATAKQHQAIAAAFALTRGDFQQLSGQPMDNRNFEYREQIDLALRSRTEYHSRFAMSTSCFFFALLGSPFAIIAAQRQMLTSFLFVFVPILLVYYPIIMMTQNMSKAGSLDPSTSVWAANAVLFAAAAVFLRLVSRN